MQVTHEFFNIGMNHHDQSNDKINHIDELPHFFRHLLLNAILNDPAADRGLNKLNLFNTEERIIKYYNCNYSRRDDDPDVKSCGTLGEREFVSCPNRRTCAAQGELCKVPFGLSPRQLEVVGEIGSGLVDKEICDKLGMKMGTLKNHKEDIKEKTGIERKPALAVLAYKLGLI